VTEFDELEAEWAGIVERRDAQAARAFLADDFILSSTGGVGPNVPKEDWLAALDEIDTRSLVPRDVDARVFGDVAVVSARLRWDATLREQDLTGDYAVTDVFTRGEGGWLASWRISVRLP
jgi:ketosteroid isomerase-like protein